MVGRSIHIQIFSMDVLEEKFPGSGEKMLEILEDLRHWHDDRYLHAITVEVVESKEQ